MTQQEKNMKDYLSAVKMGRDIFEIYYKKTANKNLKAHIKSSLELFRVHQDRLKSELLNQEYSTDFDVKFSQMCAIQMEKIKIQTKNDFMLCLEIIASLHMASIKSLKFLFKNFNSLSLNYINIIKNIMKDYDKLIISYKNHALSMFN